MGPANGFMILISLASSRYSQLRCLWQSCRQPMGSSKMTLFLASLVRSEFAAKWVGLFFFFQACHMRCRAAGSADMDAYVVPICGHECIDRYIRGHVRLVCVDDRIFR